ncbi:hypothetical protein ADK57_36705 [Streptomyces sp. MMG1533]|nr:hypothetical protein ADK57_36705 [Streptomyces sp. MMG1533]
MDHVVRLEADPPRGRRPPPDDPDRIETTARYAAEVGLEVWFSPFPCELTNAEMLPLSPTAPNGRGGRDTAPVPLKIGQ